MPWWWPVYWWAHWGIFNFCYCFWFLAFSCDSFPEIPSLYYITIYPYMLYTFSIAVLKHINHSDCSFLNQSWWLVVFSMVNCRIWVIWVWFWCLLYLCRLFFLSFKHFFLKGEHGYDIVIYKKSLFWPSSWLLPRAPKTFIMS